MPGWLEAPERRKTGRLYWLKTDEVIDLHRLFASARMDLESNPRGVALARPYLKKSLGRRAEYLGLPLMQEIGSSAAQALVRAVEAEEVPGAELEPAVDALAELVVPAGRTPRPLEGDQVVVAYRFSTELREALWANQPNGKKRPRKRIVDSRAVSAVRSLGLDDRSTEGLLALCLCSNHTRKRRSTLELAAVAAGCGLDVVDRWVSAGPNGVAPEANRREAS